ncbi:Uncharacterised protein [Vibrio cholerae]|nr:Uncharacterised protein [Vibrio cholerae]
MGINQTCHTASKNAGSIKVFGYDCKSKELYP